MKSQLKKISVKEKINRNKNFIIFFIVSTLALQSLIMNIVYEINFPYSVDWLGIYYLEDYIFKGEFPFEKLVEPHAGHYIIFPRLFVLPNLLLNSFDISNLFYFQWAILSISLFFIYLLLRKTEKSIYFILIPIAAFIYNPLQTSNYWAFAILLWLIPSLAVIMVIFLLNREKIDSKIFSLAIVISIISTFSSIIGIVSWLAGIVSLIHFNSKKNLMDKKWLAGWIGTTIVIGTIYYSFVPKDTITIHFPLLLSEKGFNFITTFVAAAFRLKFDFLMASVGGFSILLFIFCLYFFTVVKKKINLAWPWIIFILVGISDAIITGAGRVQLDLHEGNEPYYIPMSHFTQIGLLVLLSLMIVDLRNSTLQRRNILIAVLVAIIILQMILLIPSYYSGWWRAEYYFQEKSKHLECFSLYHEDSCEAELSPLNQNLNIINFWLENKLSIFRTSELNQRNTDELKDFEKIWQNQKKIVNGNGQIETINDLEVLQYESISVKNPVLTIEGWFIDDNMSQVDSLYLIVDDKPFLKYTDFKPRIDIVEKFNLIDELRPGWRISFLSAYLVNECQKFSIVGLSGEKIITLEQQVQVCKNKD